VSPQDGGAKPEDFGAYASRIMTSKRVLEYKTTVADEHWRSEEFQWARILSSGNAAKGMVLLYIQKACTAFHEFEPALKQGALKQGQVDFFRRRLAKRVAHILDTMKNNGLDKINGAADLEGILRAVESANTLDELAELTEKMHSANHTLLDSLEKE
jgi:hypothetical protein